MGEGKVKKYGRSEEESKFIKDLEELSGFNRNLKTGECSGSMIEDYRKFVESLKERHGGNWYFTMVIEEVILDD